MEVKLSGILKDLKQSELLLQLKHDSEERIFYRHNLGNVYNSVSTAVARLEEYIRRNGDQ